VGTANPDQEGRMPIAPKRKVGRCLSMRPGPWPQHHPHWIRMMRALMALMGISVTSLAGLFSQGSLAKGVSALFRPMCEEGGNALL
jgi:hypothetical protein